MDIQQVNEKLRIDQGTVVISETTLTPAVGEFLRSFYDGQPITISGVKLAESGQTAGEIRLEGVSTFLNVPDLPVSARVDLAGDGAVRAILRYRLRDLAPGPAAWVFSRSFPKLPRVSHDRPLPQFASRAARRDHRRGLRPRASGALSRRSTGSLGCRSNRRTQLGFRADRESVRAQRADAGRAVPG